MADISNTTRPAYAWDAANNQWVPIGVGAHTHPVQVWPNRGTTANRPTDSTQGDLYYDLDVNNLFQFNGTTWVVVGTNAITPSVEYLLIAGGGGGTSGGGGAGGLLTGTAGISSGTSYTFTIGAGGNAGYCDVAAGSKATNGANSTAFSLTAIGGGAGGQAGGSQGVPPAGSAGSVGGSGGGAAANGAGIAYGASGTSGQGSAGASNGSYSSSPYGVGGGGGAGAAATTPTDARAYPGGAGTASSISGSSVTYAGGGGGGAYLANSPYINTGGSGGGGNGATASVAAVAGTANRGGGGGGGSNAGTQLAGAGGSGVLIIRYANNYPDITSIDPGLTYTKTTPTGYKVYTFTAGTGPVTF